jgi:hypothetical protein
VNDTFSDFTEIETVVLICSAFASDDATHCPDAFLCLFSCGGSNAGSAGESGCATAAAQGDVVRVANNLIFTRQIN